MTLSALQQQKAKSAYVASYVPPAVVHNFSTPAAATDPGLGFKELVRIRKEEKEKMVQEWGVFLKVVTPLVPKEIREKVYQTDPIEIN